jgi:hypothetical protein
MEMWTFLYAEDEESARAKALESARRDHDAGATVLAVEPREAGTWRVRVAVPNQRAAEVTPDPGQPADGQ